MNGNGRSVDDVESVVPDRPVVCGGSWFTDAGRAQAWRHEAVAPGSYAGVEFRCVVHADLPAIRALARAPE